MVNGLQDGKGKQEYKKEVLSEGKYSNSGSRRWQHGLWVVMVEMKTTE